MVENVSAVWRNDWRPASDKRASTPIWLGMPNAHQSTPTPNAIPVKTPWTKIDDIFFGRAAIPGPAAYPKRWRWISRRVLADKNAVVSLKQIIRRLENTQAFYLESLILNGTGFGPMANHSLIMGSYISRANASIIDLRNLLEQG